MAVTQQLPLEPYVTIEVVCEHYGVNKQWVYDQEKNGLPIRRLSTRMHRFKISAIERWLDDREPALSSM
jgi:predicted DNA-binding transcriptional regulator AlpA